MNMLEKGHFKHKRIAEITLISRIRRDSSHVCSRKGLSRADPDPAHVILWKIVTNGLQEGENSHQLSILPKFRVTRSETKSMSSLEITSIL